MTIDCMILTRGPGWGIDRINLKVERARYTMPQSAWYFAGLLHYLFDGATVELDFS